MVKVQLSIEALVCEFQNPKTKVCTCAHQFTDIPAFQRKSQVTAS